MHSITLRGTFGLARLSFLLLFATFAGVSQAPAQIAVSITVAPPELPVYDQPPIPGPGYIWTPGYWAWSDDGDYYWVPGTWVEPPSVGLLWTPGYWGCNDAGIYVWNAGYWGPHVGFYGGVNYGFGYVGVGYGGGFWRGGVFSYNRTVNNFGGVHITNVYSKTVIVNNVNNHVSFNGGAGGLQAKANAQELAAANERHVQATSLQTQHQQQASTNRELRHSVNGGNPKVAAVSNAGKFEGAGVTGAHEHNTNAGHHDSPGGMHSNAVHTNNAVSNTPGHNPGANTLKPSSATLNQNHNMGNQTGGGGGTPHHGGFSGNPGGNPGGVKPQPPRTMATNVSRNNVPRGPAPRGPAPRGPAPQHQQHH